MADKIIENLITKLSFDFDEDTVEQFNTAVDNSAKFLTGLVAGTAAAATGIFIFTKGIAETNDQLGKLSQRLGVDVEELQKLGFVAELNGASIDSMNSSMESLSRIASEASIGMGAGTEAFGRLGVSVTDAKGKVKSADDLFIELADSISGLDTQAQKLELSQKLGIGADLLLTLDQGTDALLRQKKEAQELGFAFGEEGAKAAADFNDELLRVGKIATGVSNVIGAKLMKQITPVIKVFTDWFKINRALIQQRIEDTLKVLISVIRGVFNASVRVFGVINNIINAFGGWEAAIKLAAGAFLFLNANALLLPVILTAVAAAIILLIEDLQKFSKGGDSFIGNLLEDFPKLNDMLHVLLGLIGKVAEGWKLIFSDELGYAIEGFQMMIQDITNWFSKLADEAKRVGEIIQNSLVDPLNKSIELLNKIPGVDIGDRELVGRAPQSEPLVPLAGVGSSSVVNNTTTNRNTSKPNINIHIDGGNPADVRRTVKDVLSETYAGAVANFSTEVGF